MRASAAALLAVAAIAPQAHAHLSFRLPALPGMSPGGAGGYVPLDGPYLSNSPFQLTVPHSFGGNLTIGLQCRMPPGVTLTPQEIPGWTLTLTAVNNVPTAFTYQINADPKSPNGFARAAQHLVSGLRSSFVAQLGMSTPSGSCNFSDPGGAYALVGGYPAFFLQCAELSVDDTQPLTPEGIRALASGAAPLYALLWTVTPVNAVKACSIADATGEPLPGATYRLDEWSQAAPSGAACTSWPCSASAPFGGRAAAVTEVSTAPRIMFLPKGCSGPSCVAPFPGARFAGCAGGTVTMPASIGSYGSNPCKGDPAASQGVLAPVTVGNAPAAPPPAMPPPPAQEGLSAKDLTIWLAIITAVFGCFCASASAYTCARALGAGASPPPPEANQSVKPVADTASGYHADGNGKVHADAV